MIDKAVAEVNAVRRVSFSRFSSEQESERA